MCWCDGGRGCAHVVGRNRPSLRLRYVADELRRLLTQVSRHPSLPLSDDTAALQIFDNCSPTGVKKNARSLPVQSGEACFPSLREPRPWGMAGRHVCRPQKILPCPDREGCRLEIFLDVTRESAARTVGGPVSRPGLVILVRLSCASFPPMKTRSERGTRNPMGADRAK